MTKYCDVHGAVEASNDQTICGILFGGSAMCGTLLKPTPEDLVKRARPALQGEQSRTADAGEREGRSDKLRHQDAFLLAFRSCASVSDACRTADLGRTQVYEWLKDPAFERDFLEAGKLAAQHIVDEGLRRAMAGSDRLMVKMLESISDDRVPLGWKFNRPQKHEHGTQPGHPMELNVSASEQLHSRIASLVAGSTEAKTS